MLEVLLLGQFAVNLDRERLVLPSRPAQSLLAYLALTAPTAHRREKLAALLWPDADDDNARSNLRHALWRLRKTIEARLPTGVHYLVADDLTIAFEPNAPYHVDAAALNSASNSSCSEDVSAALAAYRGELLPGFFEEWVLREREHLESIFEGRVDDVIAELVEERRWSEVVEWAEHWIAVGHAPEPAYRALMLAHSERGDRTHVALAYQRCRDALFDELGAQPSEATRVLFDKLSRGERVLPEPRHFQERVPGMESAAPGEPPFKGLQSFDETDAEWFFGREAVIARLVDRLRSEPFLALVGASGSGKSSVVRAGLVPSVRGAGHKSHAGRHVFVITPGARPLESLAAIVSEQCGLSTTSQHLLRELGRNPRALRLHLEARLTPGGRPLLVVDQFEELFTLCRDAFEREVFVDNLLAAAEPDGPANLIIALRADFYAHCAQYPELRAAISEHQEYLGPMRQDELRRAIEGPAERGDWVFDSGLVDLLVRDVGDEPGALPLLSHALLETWRRRRGRQLTLAGYAEAGGVRGAIAQTAEAVYSQRLTPDQQAIARRVFLRLTEPGEGTQDTRRTAAIAELVWDEREEPAVQSVLHELADARLITLSARSVDVAHEALIRAWPTLRSWLDEDREGLRLHRLLTQAAQEWDRLDHDAGLLYRGLRLAQTKDWASMHQYELNQLEREYLEASQAASEQEAIERETARRRELDSALALAQSERRTVSQLRQRAVLLGVAFMVALAMASLALFFGREARQSALAEQAIARTASARELAAAAVVNLNVDPERSLLLALEAVRRTYSADGTSTPEAENALHRALLASRVQLRLETTGPLSSAVFSPDGAQIATGSLDNVVRVWDAQTGRELLSMHGHTARINQVSFSPDGRHLASASDDRSAVIWDPMTGDAVLTLSGHGDRVEAVAWSPDGGRLATASRDGMLRVWDAASGAPLIAFRADPLVVYSVEFSPDGTRLVSSGQHTTAEVWDAFTGTLLLTLRGHTEQISRVAYSRDGNRIATVSAGPTDNTGRVWDATTGQQLLRLAGHTSTVLDVSFSPDSTRVATSSGDGTARVWDASDGALLFTLRGHTSFVNGVSFNADGSRLVTASADRTARIWDAGPSKELVTFATRGRPQDVAFSPDGTRIASSTANGSVQIWDPITAQELVSVHGHSAAIYSLAFSPDGRRLASGGEDGIGRVFDAATGQLQLTLAGHGDGIVGDLYRGVLGVAFSPDAKRIASAGADKTVKVWDAVTGELLRQFTGHTAGLTALRFSPDGKLLATGGDDATVRIWDFATGQELHTLRGHAVRVWGLDFSPDGTRLVTSGADSSIRIWDVRSGQELRTLAGHTGTVRSALFTADGARVISAGRDGTIRLWDAADGRLLLTLSGEVQVYSGLVLRPTTNQFAAVADDAVRMYVLSVEDRVSLAQSRVTRSLTAKECQDFLHMPECSPSRVPDN